MIETFEAHIAEYAERMGKVAESQGLELLMCHTVMDRETGDVLSGSHNTISGRPSAAIAHLMQ
jgi:hypothetical protein